MHPDVEVTLVGRDHVMNVSSKTEEAMNYVLNVLKTDTNAAKPTRLDLSMHSLSLVKTASLGQVGLFQNSRQFMTYVPRPFLHALLYLLKMLCFYFGQS